MSTKIRYAFVREDVQHQAFFDCFLAWSQNNSQTEFEEIRWNQRYKGSNKMPPKIFRTLCKEAFENYRTELMILIVDCDAGYEKYSTQKRGYLDVQSDWMQKRSVIAIPVRTIEAWLLQAKSILEGKPQRPDQVEEQISKSMKFKLYGYKVAEERYQLISDMLKNFDFAQLTCQSSIDFMGEFQNLISRLPYNK